MLELLILISVISLYIYIRFSKRRKPSAAEIKGLEGEQRVNNILKELKLVYFHDSLLKQGSVSSQFDHIVVFPNKTIIVIETKNKDGIISGSSNDEKWSQTLGRNRYEFYNPMKQNEGHINMLYKKMNQYRLYGYRVLSLVVFTSERSNLKDVPSGVIHLDDLSSVLKPLIKKTLFNRSRKFTRMLLKEDYSGNKKEVNKHKKFAKNAKFFK